MTGHVNGSDQEIELPGDPGFVGIEILPYPSMENVQGASIALVQGDGKDQNKLGASLGPHQLRELAARMLLIADAADLNRRTILMVTKRSSWIPNQVLQVRDGPAGAFHYEFLIKSLLAVPEKEKLILPGT